MFPTAIPRVILRLVLALGLVGCARDAHDTKDTSALPSATAPIASETPKAPALAATYPVQEMFVEAGSVLIYAKILGKGTPLLVLHGGPGASHDYFLPYLLPLARRFRVVFIDERGSGRSEQLEDPKGYTVEAMVDDVEAVRKALDLGQMDLLGHSFGGVVAQAYALKHGEHLKHVVLSSTFHSTKQLNLAFDKMKEKMTPEVRKEIAKLEKEGLYGKGTPWEKGRYPERYMKLAWGDGYFSYLYQRRPDPNYDPTSVGHMSWDLYREMWGSHGEFVVDGNLVSVEYTEKLASLRVPTLITVGDHDQVDPAIAEEMSKSIPGSKLVVLPAAGHLTFVDQPRLYLEAVEGFLGAKP
jgi:proline-specific peptidase